MTKIKDRDSTMKPGMKKSSPICKSKSPIFYFISNANQAHSRKIFQEYEMGKIAVRLIFLNQDEEESNKQIALLKYELKCLFEQIVDLVKYPRTTIEISFEVLEYNCELMTTLANIGVVLLA